MLLFGVCLYNDLVLEWLVKLCDWNDKGGSAENLESEIVPSYIIEILWSKTEEEDTHYS